MGIFDRFRHRAHEAGEEARSSLGGTSEQGSTATTDAAQRAAQGHHEGADAFPDRTEKAREAAEPHHLSAQEEEELARENMTAEGDPWD